MVDLGEHVGWRLHSTNFVTETVLFSYRKI